MKQIVSWRMALIALVAVVLVLAALYRRTTTGGSAAQVSPQFLQMSPAEQKAALESAERARRSRSAPSNPGE